MQDSNKQTIQSYQDHVQEYIDGTPQDVTGVVKDWLDAALRSLPKDARILEFGSAFGRDAAYIQGQGFTVQCTDATQAFVDLLQKKGFDARLLNAITDDLGGPYDLILANAVLLHFNRDEFVQVLHKVFAVLANNGRFAFTVKQGEGEEWSEAKLGSPRYFCYWNEMRISEVLSQVGFSDFSVNADRVTPKATWIQVIARK